jgi:hypothetical protein
MQKWEYRVVAKHKESVASQTEEARKHEEAINALGDEGWELVSALELKQGWRFIFKRPVRR